MQVIKNPQLRHMLLSVNVNCEFTNLQMVLKTNQSIELATLMILNRVLTSLECEVSDIIEKKSLYPSIKKSD